MPCRSRRSRTERSWSPRGAADPAKAVALAEAAKSVAAAELAHLEAVIAADNAAQVKPDDALARTAS